MNILMKAAKILSRKYDYEIQSWTKKNINFGVPFRNCESSELGSENKVLVFPNNLVKVIGIRRSTGNERAKGKLSPE